MPGALDRLANVAQTLIDKYGSTATLKAITAGGGYNPATLKNNTETITDTEVIITPPQIIKTLTDGNTTDYNFNCFCKGLNLDPKMLESLVHKSRTYKIIEVNPIYSGEIIAVYELILGG